MERDIWKVMADTASGHYYATTEDDDSHLDNCGLSHYHCYKSGLTESEAVEIVEEKDTGTKFRKQKEYWDKVYGISY